MRAPTCHHLKTFRNPDTGRRAVVEQMVGPAVGPAFTVTKTNGQLALGVEHFETKERALEEADDWTKGRATNVERVLHMMENAKSGPLMQGFIMTALERFAQQVHEAPLETFEKQTVVHAPAWKACGTELYEYLKKD